MFVLPTTVRYGLRSMLELASRPKAEASLRVVAQSQKIPLKYLESIFQKLRKAGLVKSRRGKSGGYSLVKKPGDVTILEMVEALEGPLRINDCLDKSYSRCGFSGNCRAQLFWKELDHAIRDLLRAKNLEAVLAKAPAESFEGMNI